MRTSSRCSAKLQRFITRDTSLSLSPSHSLVPLLHSTLFTNTHGTFLIVLKFTSYYCQYYYNVFPKLAHRRKKNVGVNIETKLNVDHSLLEEPWTDAGTRLWSPL